MNGPKAPHQNGGGPHTATNTALNGVSWKAQRNYARMEMKFRKTPEKEEDIHRIKRHANNSTLFYTYILYCLTDFVVNVTMSRQLHVHLGARERVHLTNHYRQLYLDK